MKGRGFTTKVWRQKKEVSGVRFQAVLPKTPRGHEPKQHTSRFREFSKRRNVCQSTHPVRKLSAFGNSRKVVNRFHSSPVVPKNLTSGHPLLRRIDYPLSRRYFAALSFTMNPIFRFSGSGGVMSWRIASNTILNCASYFFSRASSFRASWALKQVAVLNEQRPA